MARMIPQAPDPDTTPPGEIEVFRKLQDGAPDDWVILHSLDIAPWNRNRRTEIDFLVIMPDTGILCIEVKSHETIEFNGDEWLLGGRTDRRGPFKQAIDASQTFYRRLKILGNGRFARVPVVYCCIFPSAVFALDQPVLGVNSWECMDSRAFAQGSPGGFCTNLQNRLLQSIEHSEVLRNMPQALTTDDVEQIVEFCVPIHRGRISRKDEVLRKERQLEGFLRDQQKPVLNLLRRNPRLLVTGGAGTGKTLIALEVARIKALEGKRVGLFCFNKLVGGWIEKQIQGTENNTPFIVAGGVHRKLTQMLEIDIPQGADRNFWEEQFLLEAENKLTSADWKDDALFDYLVLDEAQDILARPALWSIVQNLLRGGLQNGEYALFGDFDGQVLTQRNDSLAALDDLRQNYHCTVYHLDENCRNYQVVGKMAVSLSGLSDDIYRSYMRPEGQIPANYILKSYDDQKHQRDLLVEWLKELLKSYKPEDIVLLSFCGLQNSLLKRLNEQRFCEAGNPRPNCIRYATISAFKGMESPVVILTDVNPEDRADQRNLLYTGITRAKECVRLLFSSAANKTLADWLNSNITGEQR